MLKFTFGLTALLLAGSLPQLSAAQDHETTRSGAAIEWKSTVPDRLCDYCEDYRAENAAGQSSPVSGVRTGDAKETATETPSITLTTR